MHPSTLLDPILHPHTNLLTSKVSEHQQCFDIPKISVYNLAEAAIDVAWRRPCVCTFRKSYQCGFHHVGRFRTFLHPYPFASHPACSPQPPALLGIGTVFKLNERKLCFSSMHMLRSIDHVCKFKERHNSHNYPSQASFVLCSFHHLGRPKNLFPLLLSHWWQGLVWLVTVECLE